MQGSQLTVYAANQTHRIHHMTVVDWLLDEIRKVGIQGATVVAVAEGVDTQGRYHAARFFELGEQSVAVTVAGTDGEIDALLDIIRQAGMHLFYTRYPVEYGLLG